MGHGREQREFCLSRVESRVLHDDGNVRFEHRGIVGVARDRLRIDEIVKAQMEGSPRAHRTVRCQRRNDARLDGIA